MFIEVTDRQDKSKVLININHIYAVVPSKDGVDIHNAGSTAIGKLSFQAKESYETVYELLKEKIINVTDDKG